jgi:hypothetical protein
MLGFSYGLLLFLILLMMHMTQDTCVTPLIAGERIELQRGHTVAHGEHQESGRQEQNRMMPSYQMLGSTKVVLRGLMHHIRDRVATDSRDKFYALYGILNAIGVDLPPVDYSNCLGDVYRQLFSTLLNWEPAVISLMVEAGVQSGLDEGTPPWVPNWNTVNSRGWIVSSYPYNTCEFSATPSSMPHASISGNRLAVKGFFYDRASLCSPPFRTSDSTTIEPRPETISSSRDAIVFFSKWIAISRRDISFNEAYDPLPWAILNIMEGLTAHAYKATATFTNDEQAAFDAWYRIFANAGHDELTQPHGDDVLFEKVARALSNNAFARQFFARCYQKVAGKRNLFFTQEGHIGTGPEGMIEGDRIVLVAGVPLPMVLRETSTGDYLLIGAALIPGLITGKEWRRRVTLTRPEEIALL